MNYDPKAFLAQSQLKALGFHPGAIDGLWGARSQQACDAWESDKKEPIPDQFSGMFDSRTEAHIATLKPEAQIAASRLMSALVPAMAAKGHEVRITSGNRTWSQQDGLYAQGRTKPGSIVTNAKGGQSNHNFGIAWDITLFKDGKPVWDSPLYLECANIGKAQGLDCGAFWSFHDEPHFQLKK